MKYHIILDTTNLWTSNFKIIELNQPVINFKKFIDEYSKNCYLYIPKIVLDERIFQNMKLFIDNKKNIEDSYNNLKELNIKLSISNLTNFNYEKKIKQKIERAIKKKNIKLIDYPKVGCGIVIDRYLKNKPPFNSNPKYSEKGFKDTFIWYSICEFAKFKKNDQIIFVTNNSDDFPKEILQSDFKKETNNKKDILILYSIEETKEYLDSQLNLNLKLKEINIKLQQKIREKIGDLMIAIHEKITVLNIYSMISHSEPYIFFKFNNVDSINIISDSKSTTNAIISLKLDGFYIKEKYNDDGDIDSDLILGKSVLGSRLGSRMRFGLPVIEYFDSMSRLPYRKVTVDFNISYTKFSDEIIVNKIDNLKDAF